MTETKLLRKISDNLDFLKENILEIEEILEIIDMELNLIKEEYFDRLNEIKKEGTISEEEFERRLGVKL